MIFRIVGQPGPTRSYHLLQTKRTSLAVLFPPKISLYQRSVICRLRNLHMNIRRSFIRGTERIASSREPEFLYAS